MGLQQFTKILTMCNFLDRCAGHKVDRVALGTNAQIKNDFVAQCVECIEKHSDFHTCSRKMHLWTKNLCTFCYMVVKKISDEILSTQL
jgi:hypothetical protein